LGQCNLKKKKKNPEGRAIQMFSLIIALSFEAIPPFFLCFFLFVGWFGVGFCFVFVSSTV
jgi:hypothetical protein